MIGTSSLKNLSIFISHHKVLKVGVSHSGEIADIAVVPSHNAIKS